MNKSTQSETTVPKVKSACVRESQCTYQPFCAMHSRCFKLTAVGPIKYSRSFQPKKEKRSRVESP